MARFVQSTMGAELQLISILTLSEIQKRKRQYAEIKNRQSKKSYLPVLVG
jgi:hypothetical protein